MKEAYSLVWSVLVLLLRSRVSLEAEILVVCSENLIRVDDVMESPKLAQ
jgi:hypothetical protein